MVHWMPHRKKDLSQRDKKRWGNVQILSKWALGSYVFCFLNVSAMPGHQKLVAAILSPRGFCWFPLFFFFLREAING